jgi:hypothetical protein
MKATFTGFYLLPSKAKQSFRAISLRLSLCSALRWKPYSYNKNAKDVKGKDLFRDAVLSILTT